MGLNLDLQYFSGEKTEKATPKKKEDSRKKGQAAKSNDVNTAITLFAAFLMLWFMGAQLLQKLMHLVEFLLREGLMFEITEENIHLLFVQLIKESVWLAAPILGAIMVAGIFSNFIQIGFMFSTEPIMMKLSHLDPIQGLKRIYSLRALVELMKSILKITSVGAVAFFVIWNKKDQLMRLSQISLDSSLALFGHLVYQMGFYVSMLLIALSLLDFLYQKYDFEKNIRMSKQDIKDEYKKSEGDPKIKSKIKEKQRQMAMRRMMKDIPNADVIITNPTHYAIALKYDDGKMHAPVVVAKGVDYVAQKIKELGMASSVSMVENRLLARTLYSRTDIGDPIPEDLFKAVAEILAYVYQIKKKA